MEKFKKHLVWLQIFVIVVKFCVATEIKTEKDFREIAEPLKTLFDNADDTPTDSSGLLEKLGKSFHYLSQHCTSTTTGKPIDTTTILCDKYVPIVYYIYSVFFPDEAALKNVFEVMIEVPNLKPAFVFGKFFFNHMKKSDDIKNFIRGIKLATSEPFKDAMKMDHLLKLMKTLADRIDGKPKEIPTDNNEIIKSLVEKFLNLYNIKTQLNEIVQGLDASFEESRNVDMANHELDKHLDQAYPTAEHKIQNKPIVFAFFAAHLIGSAIVELEMTSISEGMDEINTKLFMIMIYYHAWSNGLNENIWTLFHGPLANEAYVEHSLDKHMNLFVNIKVLSSFQEGIKLRPDYQKKREDILNFLLGLLFTKAHLKMESMKVMLCSNENGKYLDALSDVRHTLIAIKMYKTAKSEIEGKKTGGEDKKTGGEDKKTGGEVKIKPVLPLPDVIKNETINADRKYFQRLDRHMTNLTLNHESETARSDLSMGWLKMLSVLNDRTDNDITQEEYDTVINWHIKFCYLKHKDSHVKSNVLKSLKAKFIQKQTKTHLNGVFISRLKTFYGGWFGQTFTIMDDVEKYYDNPDHGKVNITLNWNYLVTLSKNKVNYPEKLCLIMLRKEVEEALYNKIIMGKMVALRKAQQNKTVEHAELTDILNVVIMSPQIFQDLDLWTIVKCILDYALVEAEIPKETYKLIQIFFNQIFISKLPKWDAHCNCTDDTQIRLYISDTYKKLEEKLAKNLKIEHNKMSHEMKLTNMMLLNLCLMTFYNYQQALRMPSMINGNPIEPHTLGVERAAQNRIIEYSFNIFQSHYDYDYDFIESDPPTIDEYLAIQLDKFFREDVGSEEFIEIIKKKTTAIISMTGGALKVENKSFLQNIYTFLLLNFNRLSIVKEQLPLTTKTHTHKYITKSIEVASEESIEHLLRIRHELGPRINSDSIIFKVEGTFFGVYSKKIAGIISNHKNHANQYTIYPSDTAISVQMNFAVDMMKRFINSPVKQNDIVIAYMQIIFSINFGRLVTHDEQQMKISKYIEAALAAADFIKQRNSGNGKTTDNPSQNDIELLFQSSIPQFINQMKTCVPAVGQLLDSRTFKRLSQISDKTISKISGKNLPEMFAQHTESVRSNLGLLLRR